MVEGYARASTSDQDTSIQETTLKAAGCHKVFVEKKSGTTRKGRDQLELLMDIVGEGDVVIVTRVDRLARSLKDLAALADDIKSKGAALKATEPLWSLLKSRWND